MIRKIAIPSRNNAVDDHFGHCEYYTIYTVENNIVKDEDTFKAPAGCGCKSDIAYTLRDINVDTMLAGNIGQGAINKLSSAGISVIRGCSGNTKDVIGSYLNGTINDSGLTCDHHSHDSGQQCNNH